MNSASESETFDTDSVCNVCIPVKVHPSRVSVVPVTCVSAIVLFSVSVDVNCVSVMDTVVMSSKSMQPERRLVNEHSLIVRLSEFET